MKSWPPHHWVTAQPENGTGAGTGTTPKCSDECGKGIGYSEFAYETKVGTRGAEGRKLDDPNEIERALRRASDERKRRRAEQAKEEEEKKKAREDGKSDEEQKKEEEREKKEDEEREKKEDDARKKKDEGSGKKKDEKPLLPQAKDQKWFDYAKREAETEALNRALDAIKEQTCPVACPCSVTEIVYDYTPEGNTDAMGQWGDPSIEWVLVKCTVKKTCLIVVP